MKASERGTVAVQYIVIELSNGEKQEIDSNDFYAYFEKLESFKIYNFVFWIFIVAILLNFVLIYIEFVRIKKGSKMI